MVKTHRVGLHGERTDIVKIIRDHDKRIGALARTRQLPGSFIRGGFLGVGDTGGIGFADRELTNSHPEDVQGLTLTAGVTDNYVFIDASWSYTQGAVDYDVELELSGEGVIRVMRSSDEHIKIEPVEGGALYTVRVYARSTLGRLSLMPDEAIVGTPPAPSGGGSAEPQDAPGAPQAVRVGAGTSTVTIAWDAPTEGDAASSYDVDFGEDDTFATAESVEVGGRVVSFAADPGTEYHYRVRAKNAAGVSTWVIGQVTTAAPPAGRNFTTDPITETELGDNAVSTGKLQANSVDSGKINVDELFASDAVIGKITSDSAIIASLDASKINVGTLDGDLLTFQNIDGGAIKANTLDVDVLKSSTLTSTNVTLGTGGVFRAGRTAAPFNYLLISENGITFRRQGTAAYTGGETVLNMDVASGNATISNAIITNAGSNREVQIDDGAVLIRRGGVTVGRMSGTLHTFPGETDGIPSFSLETPSTFGWGGPFVRLLASENTVDIAGINGVSIGGELRLSPGRITTNEGVFVTTEQGTQSSVEFSNMKLGRNVQPRGSDFQFENTVQMTFIDETLIVGGGSSVRSVGMRFEIPSGYATGENSGFHFQGGGLTIQSLLSSGIGSFGARLTVNNSLLRNHLSLRRGSDDIELTPSGGALRMYVNNAWSATFAGSGGQSRFFGNLEVDGNLFANGVQIANFGSMQRRRSLTQSIANATWTGITWNQTSWASSGYSGLASGISPPANGRYLITVQINCGWSIAVGQRTALRLTLNGTGLDEHRVDPFLSISGSGVVLSTVMRLFTSDRVDAEIFQNSGGARTLNVGATIDVTYLGPY